MDCYYIILGKCWFILLIVNFVVGCYISRKWHHNWRFRAWWDSPLLAADWLTSHCARRISPALGVSTVRSAHLGCPLLGPTNMTNLIVVMVTDLVCVARQQQNAALLSRLVWYLIFTVFYEKAMPYQLIWQYSSEVSNVFWLVAMLTSCCYGH